MFYVDDKTNKSLAGIIQPECAKDFQKKTTNKQKLEKNIFYKSFYNLEISTYFYLCNQFKNFPNY